MATLLLLHQPRNRSATWPARATARKGVVPEAACPLSRTIAGSRLSSQHRSLAITTCLAATLTLPRSVVFPALFRWPLTVAVPTLLSRTACPRARPKASRTAVPSTTRSATAATPLLRRPWRAQTPWLLAATTHVRATVARAVVARPASSCTAPFWHEELVMKVGKIREKQNKGLRRSFRF